MISIPQQKQDLCYFSAEELLFCYKNKTVSPLEVTKEIFKRVEKVDGVLNAFTFVNEEKALSAAMSSEKRWHRKSPRGLLDGVPVTIKDLVTCKDWLIKRGSRIQVDGALQIDSPAVARLRENNAIFIGSTTTPEFGWKGVTDSPLSGVTRNPWDLSKTPGGSSGGAAVAAALGLGPLHIGTDGGGSLRIPASFTGVFGFKATSGRVPIFPENFLGTLSHVGPMTRSVSDAALMMNVITQPDARDWYALPFDDYNYLFDDGRLPENLKIAFSQNLGYAKVSEEVARVVSSAVNGLSEKHVLVEEVAPPFSSPLNVFNIHWYAAFHRFISKFTEEQRAILDPELTEVYNDGASISLADYQKVIEERVKLGQIMNLFHETYDLLLTPTLPISAFSAGQSVENPDEQNRWPDWSPFSYPFNLTGQPACSVPCGFTDSGLPVGLQIIGPRYKDDLVLNFAKYVTDLHPFKAPQFKDTIN